ncbi:MAG: hypothetical protein CBB68_04155 [Rhodospirillaceae bacterium TMED8]|nr:hypothetical protein [Magnetovibrio sp.]OUT51532.1 MAG: hypothetical protein CBB68_04155 [Rhodospirillaceae bacterium TMED8]
MIGKSMMLRRGIPVLLFIGLVSWGTSLSSHEGATGVVKERMTLMESLGGSMKTLAKFAKGELEWDTQVVQKQLSALSSHASKDLSALFPEGSARHPSEAKPAIWTDWDEFQALWGDFNKVAKTANEAEPDSPKVLISQIRKLAKTCKSCHDDFKAD